MITNRIIYQVDAFTDEEFKGNPAGVMISDKNLETGWMQNMALEMNLSETAFIIPDGNDFCIRYFTPLNEVPLCGHATLASAHIIYSLGLRKGDEKIIFKAKETVLIIRKEADWIAMNFPQYPINKINTPADFKNIVGFEPIDVYSSSYDWILAVSNSEKEIAEAAPDFEQLKLNGLGHMIITAKSEKTGIDFVLRCFAPSVGVNEDPVTGSAHCALTPLWGHKTGKTEFNSFQLSKRTGKLNVRLDKGRVEIRGKAVTVFKADLMI